MNRKAIVDFLDNYLRQTGQSSIGPVEANEALGKAGLLKDDKSRPGKPLRDLLRKGHFPHAFQSGGKGSSWTIPKSTSRGLNDLARIKPSVTAKVSDEKGDNSKEIDLNELKGKLEAARQKYRPSKVRYLLVAEAPPDTVDRFFYYPDVKQHDYLFLGIVQALYPNEKNAFLQSGRDTSLKHAILLRFKSDGFYLLDVSELPLSYLQDGLSSQLENLAKKIKEVAKGDTKIILIKATVYDVAFAYLQEVGFENVIDVRMPFPGQGGQKLFQEGFTEALRLSGYM